MFQAGKMGKLKGVVKWGVGIDNVDLDACKRLGIPVANTPNMFGSEVADVAIGYVIGLARHLFEVNEKVKKGTWHKPQGISLKGKNVGVVGYGDIGKSVCDRLAAFGLNISVWDPGVADNAVGGQTILRTWPDGIKNCDFVILTCALTRHNVHMLDTRTLNMCKNGVRIINVARGPLIDEQALTKALKSGRVGGAALDVFEVEPVAKKPITLYAKCNSWFAQWLQFERCSCSSEFDGHQYLAGFFECLSIP